MDGYINDVQDLLRDTENNNGAGTQQLHLSYPQPLHKPGSTSNFFTPERPTSCRIFEPQHLLREPHQHYSPQALDLPPSYHYDEQHSDVLDDYDRALLAEPQSPVQWTHDNPLGTIASGRLSLPGHTAPYTPTPAFAKAADRRGRKTNVEPTSKNFREKLSQFVHTSPDQANKYSSSDIALPSSPLLNASHCRPAEPAKLWSTITSNTKKTRTNGLARNRSGDRNKTSSSLSNPHPLTHPVQVPIKPTHAPPIIQGIQLVSTHDLPDRFRSVFPFNPFNAIQSKCYPTAYQTNDNLVLSAPTGGGKTAIFELAICHLVATSNYDQYKVVYMAPTKSLCAERQRDWQAKFAALDLVCAELTGDTDFAHLRSVQSASIVITTPEKWDSMTRQWKDHAKLMQLVKLFLIDEVHMLRDNRGATLEAVVSRMKSVGSNVRFIALSATVPNSADVATWLGRDHTNQHLPAVREVFGDEFRPVKLQKHIIGLPYKGNDYGFEGICDHKQVRSPPYDYVMLINARLPNIIANHGCKKPLMIFCITRKSAQATAKYLANMWASKDPRDRPWQGPTLKIAVSDPELTNTLTSAVAFHHAGLDGSDRRAVEQGFLTGQISVICCTSTLAVGVNLPCHLVIIKNTMGYQNDGLKEYAELEVLQMLGRAGRPQFDDSAVAVIITKQEKVKKYENLITGSELLESCLHLNLIDHLNAEIGLGTVFDLYTAKRWLAGTFLYVRLRENPEHYKLDEDTTNGNLEKSIERICRRDLELLESADLVTVDRSIKATELGQIMARYYVQFKTMRTLLSLGPRSKISDILSSLVQAEEYHEIRLRTFEKKLYKEINNSNGIRFPIKVDLAMHAHKRSLLVQSELGGVDFPADEQHAKHRRTFQTEKRLIFSSVHRLIRCVVDIHVHLQDAVSARNALELARSLSAGVWDNSPFQLKQISQIGPVAIRKLVTNGINSIEALEAAEAHRIELLLSRNPPFGSKLLSNLKDFPKLRVSAKRVDRDLQMNYPLSIKLKLECGFMNDKVPIYFNREPIFICLLTERSDGHLIDFRRISAKKLNNGQDVLVTAKMTGHTQYINCYIMCEHIAGTLRCAELRPNLPVGCFPAALTQPQQPPRQNIEFDSSVTLVDDEFGPEDINDRDLVDAMDGQGFKDVENFVCGELSKTTRGRSSKSHDDEKAGRSPQPLDNGKWACNHRCKDKKACKHLCCREGLDKAPKAPRAMVVPASSMKTTQPKPLKAQAPMGKSSTSKVAQVGPKTIIEEIDLANETNLPVTSKNASRQMQSLEMLHQGAISNGSMPVVPFERPPFNFSKDGQPKDSFHNSDVVGNPYTKQSTDYSDESLNALPSPSELLQKLKPVRELQRAVDDPEVLYAAKTGLADIETYDANPSENIDLCQFDNHRSDTEASMASPSNAISVQELSASQANDAVTPFPALSASIDSSSMPLSNAPLRSNDSPSEVLLPAIPEKRQAERLPTGVDFAGSPAEVKRQKHDHMPVKPLIQESTNLDPGQEASPAPVIKPGQPAWVYEFDPVFIAEYQDFVDFV